MKAFTLAPGLIYSSPCAPSFLLGLNQNVRWRTAMPEITRRHLLASGFALSASSLLARSAWAPTATLLGDDMPAGSAAATPAVGPREQLLFDFGWKFTFGNSEDPSKDLDFGFGQGDFAKTGDFDFAKAKFDDSKWRT